MLAPEIGRYNRLRVVEERSSGLVVDRGPLGRRCANFARVPLRKRRLSLDEGNMRCRSPSKSKLKVEPSDKVQPHDDQKVFRIAGNRGPVQNLREGAVAKPQTHIARIHEDLFARISFVNDEHTVVARRTASGWKIRVANLVSQ